MTRGEAKNHRKPLPDKVFELRNSPLIDLFENEHIRTVYHIFIATFIGLFVNTAASDYLKNGEIILGLKLIKGGFGNVHWAFFGWLLASALALLSFQLFNLWAKYRNTAKTKEWQYWDYFWTAVLLTYYIASFRLASFWVVRFQLAPASSAIIVCEQTRLLMKVHAFVRSNAPKVFKHKPHSEDAVQLPPLRHFLYFLIVPTLVYKDSYPRSAKINWQFAFWRALEVVGVVFYISFVVDRFLNPALQDFGRRKYRINELILCVFENTITGILVLCSSFFLVLHSWQNFFAELTMFGDRMFYKSWWTCTDFSGWFRTWNVIVHDWLYMYVYRDMVEVVKSEILAKCSVFVVSAVVHEWILTYMFGFFFPLLLVEFLVFGTILNFIRAPKTPILNILFWYALAFGMGTLVSMYAIEYYARSNAPIANPTLTDLIIPRFLTCNCIDFS